MFRTPLYQFLTFKELSFFRRGNCKNVTLGLGCEIGLRKKTYNVLAGSVLTVWTQLEAVLTHDGNKKGTATRMQVRVFFFINKTV